MSGASGQAPAGVPTDELLRWASQLQCADLPAAAVEVLRDTLLDGLGCGLFGSTLPATRAVREVLLAQAGGGAGPCALWGSAARTAALDAVVVNAAGLNGFELDGGSHLTRNVHGAVTVLPVTLALAELTGAVSGADLLAAAAAGQEVAVRLSKALGPTVMDRGWYGTPIYATLGAAVAAGRALKLTPAQLQGGFELALLQASGLTVTSEAGMGKPLSSGEAVRSGLLCALLAQQGGRGPRHAYDHPKGFAAAFSTPEERNDAALLLQPGEPLACQHASFKAYASCGASHTTIDLLSDFLQADPTLGPATVERVEVRLNVTSARHIGGRYVPADVTTAQFNLAYCVAALLLERALLVEQFRPALLTDPRILALTERVEVRPDPSVGATATRRNEAWVKVRRTDGRVLEGQAVVSRDPDRAELRTKFAALAASAISAAQAAEVVATVDQLEHLPDAAVLARLLTANP